MSAKYAFSQTLKEVRFLFCQTGEGSGATRFVIAACFNQLREREQLADELFAVE